MRLTTNQQQVLAALQQAKCPLGAYELLDRVRDHGFNAPTQIYRALDRLTEHGLVHRLESLNAYVSCVHSSGCEFDHRAFAICESCGHVDEFMDGTLENCLTKWPENHAFSLRRSTVELYGVCANCSGSIEH